MLISPAEIPERLKQACRGRRICCVNGPPVSGKSTRAKAAAAAMNMDGLYPTFLDTSDIIRFERDNGTELGKIFDAHAADQSKGGLQPDLMVMLALCFAMERIQRGIGAFLVGTPRTLQQALWMIQSGVDIRYVHLLASKAQIQANVLRRLDENRSDDHHLGRRVRIYETDTVAGARAIKKHRPRHYHELGTDEKNIRRATILLVEAMIGRDHPKWPAIMRNIDNKQHEAGKTIWKIFRPRQEPHQIAELMAA
ncbi:MAG: nucleoside monophosphate kinase [Candidatus Pacebacteria bacterium]|nr:nucleoside monophosphate kinase [Candidatus Paceibacterota bacterium]